MPYCPKCGSEYAEDVRECIDCRVSLLPGRRPTRAGWEPGDLAVPCGSLACLFIAAGLLTVWLMARLEQLPQPLGGLILSTQPACLIAFYAVAGVVSAATFGLWLVRRLLRRD